MELLYCDYYKSMALYDINTDTCRIFCKSNSCWHNSLLINNEIICISYFGTISLIIKNNDNDIKIFVVAEIDEIVNDLIWSPKGNLIVVTDYAVTTHNIPEISLLKLIPLGLMAENTNWSNFLKKEPYDPRLFLLIAEMFFNTELINEIQRKRKYST
jgi:hypothetical protein